jgi:protein-tyrosine phosphatase
MTSDIEPRRHVALEGTYNTRDIGGYPTEHGRLTRWNTFFRSDNMHRLTPQDRDAIVGYGVRTVIDLRTTSETEMYPNVFAASAEVSYVHTNLIGDDYLSEIGIVEAGLARDRISRSYISWLDDRQPQIREILATLAEASGRPAIYHCAGGKDRTGLITALLLENAGVPRTTVVEDYALTARFLIRRIMDGQGPEEQERITTWQQFEAKFCPPEGMMQVLEHMDARYGGVKAYARAIGLSDEQVESLYEALVE